MARYDNITLLAGSNTTQVSSTTVQLSQLSFVGAGGLSVGVSNGSVVISGAAGGGAAISAGTQSTNGGTVVFSNSNNVTFGMSNSSIVTASFSQSNQNVSLYAVGNTTINSSLGLTLPTLSFDGAGAAYVGFNNNSVVINVQSSLSNINVSGGTTSNNLSNLVFSNSNNATFGLNGSTMTVSAPVNFSAGTTSGNLTQISFSNGSNVSFGLNAGTITASVATSLTNINVSGGTTSNNLSAITFSNGNGISFGLNGSTMTASIATSLSVVNFSAGTTSGNLGSVVFSNSNGVSFGLNGSTVTAKAGFLSSYEPFQLQSNITMTLNGASVSHAAAFILPSPISASFLRIPVVMSTNSTTLATAAQSLSDSAAVYSTWNAVVYSLGTGASSQSLISVASGSIGWTDLNSISMSANGTQYSITQAISGYANGAGTTLTTQYSISNTNISLTTNQIATIFSGSRFLDINFANSLSAGAYWIIYGYSSSSAYGGDANSTQFSNATQRRVYYSNHYGLSQANIAFGIMGSTNFTSGGLLGAGSFSTAGGGTTSALPISAISSSASNVRPYFQMLRSA